MSNRYKKADIAVLIFLFLLSIIVCMSCSVNLYEIGTIKSDSSVFRYMALAMTKGDVIYRDSFDHKGPLIYLLNYIGMQISYYKGVWFIELVFMFATACGMYSVSRLLNNRLVSCVVTFIAMTPLFELLIGGNFTEEYAMPFIMWATYIYLDYFLNQKISKIRLLSCGMLLMLAAMLRPNAIAVWVVFSMAVLLQKCSQKKYRDISFFLIWFCLGMLIVLVPIIVYLWLSGALGDFVNNYLLFNFSYAGNMRADESIWKKIRSFENIVDNEIMIIVFIALIVAFVCKSSLFLSVTYTIYLVIALFFANMSWIGYSNYGMLIVPVYVFPISFLFRHILKNRNKVDEIIFLCCISVFLISPWLHECKNIVRGNKEEVKEEIQQAADAVMEITGSEDKITVYGNQNIIYVLTQRLSSSKYSYQYPIADVRKDICIEYFEELEKEKPKAVVLVDNVDNTPMLEYIDENGYQLYFQNEKFQVYKR